MNNTIFVFGSNLAGRHGAGSAYYAFKNFGAKYGQGVGRQGNSYGIPTKGYSLEVLPLTTIQKYVIDFITYAREHPELSFMVVKIGCGLAGYKDSEIAPMFSEAPKNCILPEGW